MYNYDAIIRQNNDSDITFVIIDNTFLPNQSFLSELNHKDNIIYHHNLIKPRYSIKYNSFHHAIALDLGIKIIIDRKIYPNSLLILDPDFFIFGKNWVNAFCDFINNGNIYFLGSPWGNKWINKYKNFPCVQCLLINGKLINNLPSFAPIDTGKDLIMLFWRLVYSNIYLSYFIGKLFDHIPDTGSLIYNKFRDSSNVIFNETSFNDLKKSNFFSNYAEFTFIISMVKKLSDQIEIFEFDMFKCLHFRSFGNKNSKNEK